MLQFYYYYYFYQMKTLSVIQAKKTLDSLMQGSETITSQATSTREVKRQIGNKYKTLIKWNHKGEASKKKKASFALQKNQEQTNNANMLAALMKYTQDLKKKEAEKQKSKLIIEELDGVKAERRERFKKITNPLMIIQHYMSKENYKPSEEEDHIIQKILKLKEKIDSMNPIDLDTILSNIYKIMNMAVDYNKLRFLILLVVLAGEISFEMRDMHRGFYFYNQARIACTYAGLDSTKLQCLIQMARIALQLQQYDSAIKLFKKALQYAWKVKDHDSELRIFDYVGQAYYYSGANTRAAYFHNRFIQGQLEKSNSAVRRISQQMLQEYQKLITENCENQNLSELFIQYLDLPITNFKFYPATRVKKDYDNYKEGESPRKYRLHKDFNESYFYNAEEQIQQLFSFELEFRSEIPNPDLQRNFFAQQKFGRLRKNIPFEKSIHYHKITGMSPPSSHGDSLYKLPMNERIDKKLSERANPNWWEDMLENTKKKKQEKVGQLKDKFRKSHLSYHKYPEEKRRTMSLRSSKIKESINKTLLNWIDPQR